MARSSQYWSARRKKSGKNFVKNAGRAFTSPSVGSIARLAWSGVKGIRALINAEKHFVDFAGSVSSAAAGQVFDLSQIAQGDTLSTRTGNSVLVNNVSFRSLVSIHGSASNTLVKYMLVQDTQQVSDTAPTAADILESVSPISPLKRTNLGRFKVLTTRVVTLTQYTTSRKVNIFRKFQRHHFRYNGIALSDIQKGGLYVIVVHNEATNLPTVAYNFTTAFYDN